MTWTEMYVVALVVTPIAAALIAFVVCWRDRHHAHHADGHKLQDFGHTNGNSVAR